MAILEYPSHQRYLAAAILHRAVFDLTSRSRSAPDAWEWFFLEAPDDQERFGWDFDDTARVLELSVTHLRQALIRAGYEKPPQPMIGGQREKIAGIIPCRMCGVACAAPDIRIQRTCPACGGRLRLKYLRRQGLVSGDKCSRVSRLDHARAALVHVLYQGPLPARFVHEQLHRVGLPIATIKRARAALRVQAKRLTGDGPWILELAS